jgi:RNA polymerase sigma-70 factor (ECF subfamily)
MAQTAVARRASARRAPDPPGREHRRSGRRPKPVELSAPLTESAPGGNAEVDELLAIEADHVADVLADLVPDQREVLTLRAVGDLTVEQVAEVLGKNRGAVKSLQRRGVAALRRRLGEAAR